MEDNIALNDCNICDTDTIIVEFKEDDNFIFRNQQENNRINNYMINKFNIS